MFNELYYVLKPFVPRWLAIFLRRQRAAIKRTTHAGIWPIDERAGSAPRNWPGWPEAKRFALVLTHDVESTVGIRRIPQLMSLEQKYGLRSSFNLVPEGEYQVSESLLRSIDDAGFEVGVHGLEHDGKLYASKTVFARKANSIRQYLRGWSAFGFRSPLMQHKLRWLHQVGADYDASTFDTDPFEPQPDGVSTIFPFWVPGPDGDGYVELPYTLAQDFTLFVVLREKNIDIWKQKVDWIAARGGMVLLNTHPDYMQFEGTTGRYEFPVSFYEELLSYIQTRYAGNFWSALPREVTRFYRASLPQSSRNTRRKVCLLTSSTYESDNQARGYAEALAERGDLVDVISLAGKGGLSGTETLCGVRLHRVLESSPKEASKWRHALHLFSFMILSSWLLTRRHHRLRYDLIHIRHVPGLFVFAAWYPLYTGVPVVLDINGIAPDAVENDTPVTGGTTDVRAFTAIERLSMRFVNQVIVYSHQWHQRITARLRNTCSILANRLDASTINARHERTRVEDAIRVVVSGAFHSRHGGSELGIRAFACLRKKIPNAKLYVYGGSSDAGAATHLVTLANDLGLNGSVHFCETMPLNRMRHVMAGADLGVIPAADNSSETEPDGAVLELMAYGVPVVISKTRHHSLCFKDNVVLFFPPGDVAGLTKAMLEVIENRDLRQTMVARAYEYADHHGFYADRQEYFKLVDRLCTEIFDGASAAL